MPSFKPQFIAISLVLAAIGSFNAYSSEALLSALEDDAMNKCSEFQVSKAVCDQVIKATKKGLSDAWESGDSKVFSNTFTDTLKNYLKTADGLNEAVFNSGLFKSIDYSPLGLQFKVLDVDDGDTVIGLTFDYSKTLSKNYLNSSQTMHKYYSVDIKTNGTVTKEAEENPRNFIEAKISLAGGMHTKMPAFPDDVKKVAQAFMIDPDSKANQLAYFDAVEGILAPLGGHTFIKYGLEAGYETDQKFDKQSKVVSGFSFASYESYDPGTFLGSSGLVPSIRLSVDQVSPNAESPRALAGDDSSYTRASGEISIWMPLTKFLNRSAFFTFNYRGYRELSASKVVKDAGLDSYHLRTYTISGDGGLFISYSSGKLPFDLKSQNAVELGFKTHF